MSKPLKLADMKRRNRRLGDVIRSCLQCPVCEARAEREQLRVVAYRMHTVRMECKDCGFRFTANQSDVVDSLEQAGGFLNAMASVVYLRDEI